MVSSDQKRNKRKAVNANKFLEALRDLGEGVVDSAVHDVAQGVAESAVDQVIGKKKTNELKPNQDLNIREVVKEKQEEKKAREFQKEFLGLQRQEKTIFTRAEQETKLQIATLLEELKRLANSTQSLAKEVEIAAKQVPVEPGIYHLSFFEKLRKAILLFKKRVEESTTWLAAFNQRAKRRSYYWAQVKKSGTKFMLSQERYMATQAG